MTEPLLYSMSDPVTSAQAANAHAASGKLADNRRKALCCVKRWPGLTAVELSSKSELFSGCDCIHKTGDRGLIQQISIAERKLRDVKNAVAKARKEERTAKRVEAAKVKLESVRGTLASQPHPNQYFAEQGKTLLDYVNFCLKNRAGDKAAFIIERTRT